MFVNRSVMNSGKTDSILDEERQEKLTITSCGSTVATPPSPRPHSISPPAFAAAVVSPGHVEPLTLTSATQRLALVLQELGWHRCSL